jgi:hypothetical protein
MANDSEGDATEGDVFAEAEADGESEREVQLVEDEGGFWTLVDSDRGAVGDAPTKAAGLTLMEQYLEDMEGVSIPDVEPEEPSERPDRDPKLPPEPSMPDDDE